MFQMHPNQQKTCVVCRKKMTEFELYKHIKNSGKLFKEMKVNRLIDQKYQYMINDVYFTVKSNVHSCDLYSKEYTQRAS